MPSSGALAPAAQPWIIPHYKAVPELRQRQT